MRLEAPLARLAARPVLDAAQPRACCERACQEILVAVAANRRALEAGVETDGRELGGGHGARSENVGSPGRRTSCRERHAAGTLPTYCASLRMRMGRPASQRPPSLTATAASQLC